MGLSEGGCAQHPTLCLLHVISSTAISSRRRAAWQLRYMCVKCEKNNLRALTSGSIWKPREHHSRALRRVIYFFLITAKVHNKHKQILRQKKTRQNFYARRILSANFLWLLSNYHTTQTFGRFNATLRRHCILHLANILWTSRITKWCHTPKYQSHNLSDANATERHIEYLHHRYIVCTVSTICTDLHSHTEHMYMYV